MDAIEFLAVAISSVVGLCQATTREELDQRLSDCFADITHLACKLHVSLVE